MACLGSRYGIDDITIFISKATEHQGYRRLIMMSLINLSSSTYWTVGRFELFGEA